MQLFLLFRFELNNHQKIHSSDEDSDNDLPRVVAKLYGIQVQMLFSRPVASFK